MRILHIISLTGQPAGIREEELDGELTVENVRKMFPGHKWCPMDEVEVLEHMTRKAIRVEIAQDRPFTWVSHIFVEV